LKATTTDKWSVLIRKSTFELFLL